ncbi:MAG: hypothetical protein ACYC0J_06120 [Gammaproteobacteria bacterium]
MSYITREDGEHFVIPSYRDVLSSKRKSQLKKDILALSQSYGEYITLQQKNSLQYEVAFSPDTGYLLGESIWQYFKRPLDMIYCEAVPNSQEALLVIVKAGSVYLDGSFPLDSIPEELIIFLTQQNNFEIYTYGDVPLVEHPTDGKFAFEETAVKSFTVLDKPVFPDLPLLKIYQLQLVDTVLKAHGIGTLPLRPILTAVAFVVLAWFAWSHFTAPSTEEVQTVAVDPYQPYYDALSMPSPAEQIEMAMDNLDSTFSIPGWQPVNIEYANGILTIAMQSIGSKVEMLFEWANQHKAEVLVKVDSINLMMNMRLNNRVAAKAIYPTREVVGALIDRIATVYPGNVLQLASINAKGGYSDIPMNIKIEQATPLVIRMIGNQLHGLPVVLQGMKMTVKDGQLTGSISIDVLGS